MKRFAIIVAGGSGARMQTAIPKQFLPLHGLPVLMHTLHAFSKVGGDVAIILSLPIVEMDRWSALCKEFNFAVPHQVVAGGETRYHSVKNALAVVPAYDAIVAVHDGVRPLIKPAIIEQSFQQALSQGSAVVAVGLKDSIRSIAADGSNAHQNRANYVLVQTPQTFRVQRLKVAYEKGYQAAFTDDASVLEADGGKVHLMEGDYSNIKITTPEDMLIAEVLLKKKSE